MASRTSATGAAARSAQSTSPRSSSASASSYLRHRTAWVTTPQNQTLTVLDASKPDTLKAKTTIKLEGDPEGYAVDASRGLFFTNLEDKNKTVVIDVASH